jgi:hypothetical protein
MKSEVPILVGTPTNYQAAASVAVAVNTLLSTRTGFDFLLLKPHQIPVQPDRFEPVDFEVGSMFCDPFTLAEKLEQVIAEHLPTFGHRALVATSVTVLPGDRTKLQAWNLRVMGWWVPVVLG